MRHSLVLALLAPAACSLTSSLDDLKQGPADASTGGSAGTAGTDGGSSGSGGSASCAPGACSGCVGCEAFCTCSTPSTRARDLCIKGCTDGGGSGGAAGTGGDAGASGSGGTGATGGTGGTSQSCQDCANTHCSAELQACSNNSACVNVYNCIGMCPDAACRQACLDQGTDEGKDLFLKHQDCVVTNCLDECT